MKLTGQEKAFLHKLEQHGIQFITWSPHGYCSFSIEHLASLLEAGPDVYYAWSYGVSAEHYAAWKEQFNNPHCHALNHRGEPCRAYVEQPSSNPRLFDPVWDVYCYWHRPSVEDLNRADLETATDGH